MSGVYDNNIRLCLFLTNLGGLGATPLNKKDKGHKCPLNSFK